jgi:hypothetical protein
MTAVEFFLGTHQPGWLSWSAVPLLCRIGDSAGIGGCRAQRPVGPWTLAGSPNWTPTAAGITDRPRRVRCRGSPLPRRDRPARVGGAAELDV